MPKGREQRIGWWGAKSENDIYVVERSTDITRNRLEGLGLS